MRSLFGLAKTFISGISGLQHTVPNARFYLPTHLPPTCIAIQTFAMATPSNTVTGPFTVSEYESKTIPMLCLCRRWGGRSTHQFNANHHRTRTEDQHQCKHQQAGEDWLEDERHERIRNRRRERDNLCDRAGLI